MSHLAIYAERHKFGGVFSGLFRWLGETRSLVAILALIVGLYAFVIRPLYMGKSTYSVLIEWMLVLLLGFVILGIARFRAGTLVAETVSPDWRRHRQQTEPMTDAEYLRLKSHERRFIEDSDQTMLAYFAASLLSQNGVKESSIASVLKPLVEYRGQATHESRRQAQEGRSRLLKSVVAGMQSAAQPSRYATHSRQSAYDPNEPIDEKEAKTISTLAEDFYKEGDCTPLFVRMCLLAASSGTREDDIELVLRPLVMYSQSSRIGQDDRKRLWQEVVTNARRIAPRLSLKE